MGLHPVLYKQIFDDLFVKFQKLKMENRQQARLPTNNLSKSLKNERLMSTNIPAPNTKALSVFAPTSIMTYDKYMKIKTKKNSSGTSNNSSGVQSTDSTPARRWTRNPKEVFLKISKFQTASVTWWKMNQVKNVILWTQGLSKKYIKQDTTTPSCEALFSQNEAIMEEASEDEVSSTEEEMDHQTKSETQSLFYGNYKVAAPITMANQPQTLSPLNPVSSSCNPTSSPSPLETRQVQQIHTTITPSQQMVILYNKIYQYRSLAFGLIVAPQVLTKLMRYAIEPLRKKGIRLVFYLGDICILAKTER